MFIRILVKIIRINIIILVTIRILIDFIRNIVSIRIPIISIRILTNLTRISDSSIFNQNFVFSFNKYKDYDRKRIYISYILIFLIFLNIYFLFSLIWIFLLKFSYYFNNYSIILLNISKEARSEYTFLLENQYIIIDKNDIRLRLLFKFIIYIYDILYIILKIIYNTFPEIHSLFLRYIPKRQKFFHIFL